MGFNLGNAMKYIWRADEKNNAVEDLRKAVWYVQREIAKRIK
jgi:DNA-binding SARP family transcriptional activator